MERPHALPHVDFVSVDGVSQPILQTCRDAQPTFAKLLVKEISEYVSSIDNMRQGKDCQLISVHPLPTDRFLTHRLGLICTTPTHQQLEPDLPDRVKICHAREEVSVDTVS